ncbi:MAG TPA: hypothetical protein VLZ83_14045 [Edaphocola sp.]|nr:hypothetical protein [Edaphocola sp.]
MSLYLGGNRADFAKFASIYKRVYEIPGNKFMQSASPSWNVLSTKDENGKYKYSKFIDSILNRTETMSDSQIRNMIEGYIYAIQQYEYEEPLDELNVDEIIQWPPTESTNKGFKIIDDYKFEITNDIGFAQTNGLISDEKLDRLLDAINRLTDRIELIAVDLGDLHKAMKITQVVDEIVKEDIAVGDMTKTAENIETVNNIIKEEILKEEVKKPKKKCKPGQVLKTVTYKKKSGKVIGPYEQCIKKKCKPGEKLEITKGYTRRSGKYIEPYGKCVKKKTKGGMYLSPYERLLAAGVI